MKKDLNQIFPELLGRYIKTIQNNYQLRYRRAKDKEFVFNELNTDAGFIIGWESLAPENSQIIDVFSKMYKRGDNISDILTHIKKIYGEVENERPFKRIENGKKITLYLGEEEKALKKLALDERKLLKLVIRHTAYREIQKKLPTMFEEQVAQTKTKSINVQWTAPKETKNEFVQLIYGLHQAGFINKGQGEITKITENLAEIFGIDLGKNWQSNHSASIHKANKDYQPPIFDKIKEAYHRYTSDLRGEKKKNK
ncbi:MAG: RteC domain-containing protein [Bacteroidetes bacterium]|nr:RteC domain-containing protein [Bacteroidota bacterium]